LAERYGQPVPKLIPAHWLPNRWGQEWGGLVESVDLDAALKSKPPEWLIQTAEEFIEFRNRHFKNEPLIQRPS